jgi:hypothetical protein
LLWSKSPDGIRRTLFAARTATIAVVLAGGWLLGLAAAAFGGTARVTAHALWAFSPTVLANGALATHDAWAAALLCAVLWTFVRYARAPFPGRVVALGVALGLAAACKSTVLLVAPVAAAAVAMVERQSGGTRARCAAILGLCGLAAALTIWAIYGFRSSNVPLAPLQAALPGLPRRVGPIPAGRWVAGLLEQWELGVTEHVAYAMGRVFHSGVWWFYLAVVAFKTTIATPLANAAARVRRGGSRLVDAGLLAFPLVLLLVLSDGVMQRGARYLLPAFPFVMLWLARSSSALAAETGRAGRLLVAACLAAGAVESVAVHPHHLMFFNAWAGGPSGGPRRLVVGDDWGQDQRRVAAWQNGTNAGRIYYTPYTQRPDRWAIEFDPPPCAPAPGHYALHAVEVHRPRRIDEGCLDWLTVEPPDRRLGYSVYVYVVDGARIARLESERGRVAPFWRSGR